MSARGKSSFLAVGNASLWLPCHAQILPRSLLHLMMIPQLILPKLISSKFLDRDSGLSCAFLIV